MREALRLLAWIVDDIDRTKENLYEAVDYIRGDKELEQEIEETQQEITEARRKLLHASDVLQRIYTECYERYEDI